MTISSIGTKMRTFKQFISESTTKELIELANEFISEFDDKQAKDEWGSSFADVTNEPGNCAMVSETFIKWAKKKGPILSRQRKGQFN